MYLVIFLDILENKREHRSSHLHSSLFLLHLIRLLAFDQCAELRFAIKQLIISFLVSNDGVVPRNANILNLDFALMAASHLEPRVRLRVDHYHSGKAPVFFLLFKNHERSLRPVERNQIIELVFVENSSLELLSADLALHSCPCVDDNPVAGRAHDFVLEPFFETEKMHELQTAARVESHVLDFVF